MSDYDQKLLERLRECMILLWFELSSYPEYKDDDFRLVMNTAIEGVLSHGQQESKGEQGEGKAV